MLPLVGSPVTLAMAAWHKQLLSSVQVQPKAPQADGEMVCGPWRVGFRLMVLTPGEIPPPHKSTTHSLWCSSSEALAPHLLCTVLPWFSPTLHHCRGLLASSGASWMGLKRLLAGFEPGMCCQELLFKLNTPTAVFHLLAARARSWKGCSGPQWPGQKRK